MKQLTSSSLPAKSYLGKQQEKLVWFTFQLHRKVFTHSINEYCLFKTNDTNLSVLKTLIQHITNTHTLLSEQLEANYFSKYSLKR